MGNNKSKEEVIKTKKEKLSGSVAKSISLRSLASFGKGKYAVKKTEEEVPAYTESYVDQINQNIFAPQLNSVFCPEFAFRSDICSSDFKYLSKLGEGTFSTVYRASWFTRKNMIVAIKVQNKAIILNKGASKQIKRESDIHKCVSSSIFIAGYFDCWQTSSHLFTVMECIDGFGDLYTLWKTNKYISEDAIRIYAAEIGSLLDYLKTCQVVYRDFKMENLALDYRKHIKLIDFGFARRLMNEEKATTICGTLQYMAPEVAKEQYYGFEVDWWCFGIVLYVISEDQYPFSNNNAKTHSELNYDSTITFTQTSKPLKELITNLLKTDPLDRISTFEDIKVLQFFPSLFDFENVHNYEIEIDESKPLSPEKITGYNFFQW